MISFKDCLQELFPDLDEMGDGVFHSLSTYKRIWEHGNRAGLARSDPGDWILEYIKEIDRQKERDAMIKAHYGNRV